MRLASLHNLRFYFRMMERARRAILEGDFTEWRSGFLEMYNSNEGLDRPDNRV